MTSLGAFRLASSDSQSVDAEVKFRAAVNWSKLTRVLDVTSSALDGYTTAINLLPQLVWRGLSTSAKQRIISSRLGTLAVDAAACAIELAELERAVELLEQGRSSIGHK
jgi:uncharacterized membrane protein (DUF4010 family)